MDYQGNSKKDKEPVKPDKVIEKVTVDEVIVRPVPLGTKFKHIFLGGEFKDSFGYVMADVLLPALRNLVVDMTIEGVKRMVYGESRPQRGRAPEYRPRITYNSPINRTPTGYVQERANLPDQPNRYGRRRDTNQHVFTSRKDAENVLEEMLGFLENYDLVTVADMLELMDQPSTPVDNKWGWTVLVNIEIRQVRDGYLIDLPPAEPIN